MPGRVARMGIATLLTTTALTSVSSSTALAQVVIDGGAETVDGGGGGTQASPWNIGDELIVGDTGTGILNVFNGGVVTSDAGYLGYSASGDGSVGVTGTGSSWSVVDRIWVGYEGNGSLTVSDGATVSSAIGNIGYSATSTGGVTVTDAGSAWTMSSALSVGIGGVGYLTVSDGGAVTSNGLYVGDEAGSYGEVTVYGAGASLDVGGGFFFIGHEGTGVLNVQDSATVTVTTSSNTVGSAAGSSGTINVITGGVLDLSTPAFFTVGSNGDGAINVTDATVLGSSNIRFGLQEGSVGTLSLSGASASWSGGSITAGSSGTGTVSVSNGADMSVGTFTLGLSGTGSGTLTIDNATLAASSYLAAGWSGYGQVTVQNGGSLTSGSTIGGYLGYASGGSGDVTVTGAGSAWTANGDLSVGYEGTGSLSVLDSGEVTVTGDLLVGDLADGTGTVTVDDAVLNAGAILVGNAGTGTMTVSGGGNVDADDFIVGNDAGSNGTATVTETGSNIHLTTELSVGHAGTGTLNVTDGGNILVEDGVRVGSYSGGTGTINIDGSASEITNYVDATIGDEGNGTVAMTNGADFYNDGDTYIGSASTGTGSLSLDGSGTYWENGGDFRAGVSGSGSVSLTNGAQIANNYAYFGRDSAASASILVDGTGSSWTNTGDLYVGEFGTVDLTISNGAAFSNSEGYIGYDTASSGTVTVSGSGSSWTNTSDLYVGEAGNGTLVVSGGGTVGSVSGFLAYDSVSSGSATVTGTGSTWTMSGALSIAERSVGSLTISDGGVVDVDSGSGTVDIATLTGSTGTLNIGAAAGDPSAGAGALNASSVDFGAGTGLIVFNHTDTGYTFAAPITGVGDVEVYSGETILTAANTYSGTTTINGGSLIVNGSLVSDVTLNGGTLGGSGTVGLVSMASGSVAPGNSVGTLNVSSLTIDPGSIYEVELNDGGFVAGTNNDLIDATGAVTINGGTVNVTPENGTDDGSTYALGTYNILTAAGGVSGTFDDVTDDYIFLDFTLGYDANNVYLTSEQVLFFTDLARTPNQLSTAGALEALGSGNAVYDGLVTLAGDDAAVRAAYDSLSGEIHTSARTALIEDSRAIRNAANERMRMLSRRGRGARVAYASNSAQIEPVSASETAVWAQAFGAVGKLDDNGNAASMDRTLGGFLIGADTIVAEQVRLGLMGGYGRSNFDVDDRLSSGSADSYHVGAYGAAQMGTISLRFGSAFAWHDIDTSRTANAGTLSNALSASYNASTVQVFGEAGYRLEDELAGLEPFIGMAYVHTSTDGFTETGGATALTVGSSSANTAFTTLGLRAEGDIDLGQGEAATLSGMLGWRYAFGDVTPSATMNFAGNAPFSIKGVPLARNTLAVDLGAGMALSETVTLGVAYSGEIGASAQDHGFRATLVVAF